MQLTCVISKIKDKDKEILYEFKYDLKLDEDIILKSKNAVPTVIYHTIEALSETNIPESIQEFSDSGYDLGFCIVGKGINVEFDIKSKR